MLRFGQGVNRPSLDGKRADRGSSLSLNLALPRQPALLTRMDRHGGPVMANGSTIFLFSLQQERNRRVARFDT